MHTGRRTARALSAAVATGMLAACGGGREASPTDTAAPTPGVTAADTTAGAAGTAAGTPVGAAGAATAALRDSAGRDLGTVTLTETAEGIAVAGTLRGLPPGAHAIHLHTTGRCEPPFESAGGHWNPTNKQHGTENPQGPHLGDMPNVTVGADSSAAVQVTTPGGTLRGTTPLFDGDSAAVMVHAGADDYRSDPAGAAGGRIACGVVRGS